MIDTGFFMAGNIKMACMIQHHIEPQMPVRFFVDFRKLNLYPGAKINTGALSISRFIILCEDGYHRMRRPSEIMRSEISAESLNKIRLHEFKIRSKNKIEVTNYTAPSRRWLRYPMYLSCSSGSVNGVILE